MLKIRFNLLKIIVISICLAGSATMFAQKEKKENSWQRLQRGKQFPNLTVEKLNGEKLSFKDLIGKTIVINWWHTTCPPCIAEIPGLNKLAEQYKDNPDVMFIAIAKNQKEEVISFLEKREFNYIQTLANEEVIQFFGNGFPKNVIVNSEGKIRFHYMGGTPDINVHIERILKDLLENK